MCEFGMISCMQTGLAIFSPKHIVVKFNEVIPAKLLSMSLLGKAQIPGNLNLITPVE